MSALDTKGELLQQIRWIGDRFDSIVVAAYIRLTAGLDTDDTEDLKRAETVFDLVKISVG
jgi:hypothetical protein